MEAASREDIVVVEGRGCEVLLVLLERDVEDITSLSLGGVDTPLRPEQLSLSGLKETRTDFVSAVGPVNVERETLHGDGDTASLIVEHVNQLSQLVEKDLLGPELVEECAELFERPPHLPERPRRASAGGRLRGLLLGAGVARARVSTC